MSYKKTQKDNSMKSGIRYMNKMSSLPERLKLFKKCIEILEMKNQINEIKNAIESFRAGQTRWKKE